MKNTDMIAKLLFAFTQLPDLVREDCSETFKYVINMLKKEDQEEGQEGEVGERK